MVLLSGDEEVNNDVTTAFLFDMTSSPTPFKPGGTQQSFIRGGSALRSNPLLYIPFLTEKVPLLCQKLLLTDDAFFTNLV